MQITKALGAYFLMPGADLLHDFEIDAEEVVAAHAGLARHPGGDDAHRRAFERLVGIGAGHAGVKPFDRRRLHQIERLALRHALHDVEQDDVAELLETNQERQRPTDLTRANQCNLVPRHPQMSLRCRQKNRPSRSLDLSAARSSRCMPIVGPAA